MVEKGDIIKIKNIPALFLGDVFKKPTGAQRFIIYYKVLYGKRICPIFFHLDKYVLSAHETWESLTGKH